eukprot:2506779-Pyramimonas_sp.AAC.1
MLGKAEKDADSAAPWRSPPGCADQRLEADANVATRASQEAPQNLRRGTGSGIGTLCFPGM